MRIPALEDVQAEKAKRSLSDFIRYGWKYIDPAPYTHGKHIDVICEHLQAVNAGEVRKLLINIPPRHMKSLAACVAWPAWTWAQEEDEYVLAGPQTKWIYASYGLNLAMRDSLKTRRLVESPWYQKHWGHQVEMRADQAAKQRFENTAGGMRYCTSVDGPVTGEGGDIIVIDDPHNVKQMDSVATRTAALDWFDETLPTRVNDPSNNAWVVIMQRIKEDDLSGHILAEKHGWEHLCFPAEYEVDHPFRCQIDWRTKDGELLWPERWTKKALDDLDLGEYARAGQLQQRPTAREGGMFKKADFRVVDKIPGEIKFWVRYWDLAGTEKTSDNNPAFTAGVHMGFGEGICIITDVQRFRESAKKVEDNLKKTAKQDGKKVPIYIEQEPGSSGKSVIDSFARKVLAEYAVRGDKVTGAKELRADALSAKAENGNLLLLRGAWNTAFIDECCLFPNGKYLDQVDAASGALNILLKVSSKRSGIGGMSQVAAGERRE